ncbi:MAG: hypothetical protein JF609_00160 [Verrucomicrobia bacterium]|nr:hypothetical protein [Verrucomicrobiota bacterium]
MKLRAAQIILFLALVSLAALISGCSELEPDNASVRPWNTPQGWEGSALGGMDGMQHR